MIKIEKGIYVISNNSNVLYYVTRVRYVNGIVRCYINNNNDWVSYDDVKIATPIDFMVKFDNMLVWLEIDKNGEIYFVSAKNISSRLNRIEVRLLKSWEIELYQLAGLHFMPYYMIERWNEYFMNKKISMDYSVHVGGIICESMEYNRISISELSKHSGIEESRLKDIVFNMSPSFTVKEAKLIGNCIGIKYSILSNVHRMWKRKMNISYK